MCSGLTTLSPQAMQNIMGFYDTQEEFEEDQLIDDVTDEIDSARESLTALQDRIGRAAQVEPEAEDNDYRWRERQYA